MQELVQANGICLSMKRINTIFTEEKEEENREKKTERKGIMGGKKQGETGQQSERA